MRPDARVMTCPACGRDEPSGARWCGDCGAPLVGFDQVPVDVEVFGHTEFADGPAPATQPRRVWRWLVAVVGAVAVASVLVDPAPTDTTLLGRLDDATGRSSSAPPTDGLQLLWRRPVDAAGSGPTAPPALTDLGRERVLLGDEVVDVATGASVVDLGPGSAGAVGQARTVRPDAEGRVAALDHGDLVLIEAASGRVHGRAPLSPGPWTPTGDALGWVAGAVVFADADGVLGAVEPAGEVRWVGDPSWSWDGTGNATWLVVRHVGSSERVLVVDGRDGTVALDLGSAETVHAPVVHGDTVVWVDPLRGIDRGLGHPVQVRGAWLDGTGTWDATYLSPTSGRPTAVQLTPVADSVAVHYWATGDTTTAVWLDPADGAKVGGASVHGSGRTDEGWPVTAVVDGGLAHVDRAARRIRLVDRSGAERWSIPSVAGEGLVAHGAVVLVRTPPRGTSLQSRLRLVDATTGEVLLDRLVDSAQQQRLVGVLGGHVGVAAGAWPVPLDDQAWFALADGGRQPGPALAAEALDLPLPEDADLVLLGTMPSEAGVRPILLLPDAEGPGRIIGLEPGEATPSAARLLGDPTTRTAATGTVGDDELAVTVGAGSVVARDPRTGQERWRVLSDVALQPGRALLLGEVVVALGVDGVVRAWDRDAGTRRWDGPDVGATAMSAGGDAVVLGTATGEVVVLGAGGRLQQRVEVGSDPVEDVAVVDGRVLATVGPDVVALGRGTVVVDPADRVPAP